MEELLQRYHDYLCGEHTKERTITCKLDAARILLRHTKGNINQTTMQQFKAWANNHYSHNSRNNRINSWNQYLRWAGYPEHQMKHIGFIETNQHALTETEIDLVIQHAADNPLHHLIILCLFDGALRPSEIIDIQLDHRENNRLYLDDTKTGDKRIILSPRLIHAWDTYQDIRPAPRPGHEHYLILKQHSKQTGMKYLDTDPINDIIQQLAAQAGINQHITAYTIRRTSATLRQSKYSNYYMGDDKLVQMLFRHKDLATTKRYDRTTDQDIERYFNEQCIPHKPGESGSNHPVTPRNKIYANDTTISYSPQDLNIKQEDEDNTCFSFSYFFYVFDSSFFTGRSGAVGFEPAMRSHGAKHDSFPFSITFFDGQLNGKTGPHNFHTSISPGFEAQHNSNVFPPTSVLPHRSAQAITFRLFSSHKDERHTTCLVSSTSLDLFSDGIKEPGVSLSSIPSVGGTIGKGGIP